MNSNLKICIPIPHQNKGGMFTFLASFRKWLDQAGVAHTEEWRSEYDVLFVNSWAVPVDILKQVKRKRPHVKIIQRVDGSGQDYGRTDDADERQAEVGHWADQSIFQSHYSKYATMQKFKIIYKDGPIIYNPVDLETFFPKPAAAGVTDGRIRVCNASFSVNKMKGTWQFAQIARQNPAVDFVLCGHYPPLPKLPNIIQMGHLNRQQLAQTMRSCHVYTHLAENDPCPNVVIEALASGLPVLYKESGGPPELVQEAGLPVTADNFSVQLSHLTQNHATLSEIAHERAKTIFAPEKIFPQYLQAIEQADAAPAPDLAKSWRKWQEGYPVWPRSGRQVTHWLKRTGRHRWQAWGGR